MCVSQKLILWEGTVGQDSGPMDGQSGWPSRQPFVVFWTKGRETVTSGKIFPETETSKRLSCCAVWKSSYLSWQCQYHLCSRDIQNLSTQPIFCEPPLQCQASSQTWHLPSWNYHSGEHYTGVSVAAYLYRNQEESSNVVVFFSRRISSLRQVHKLKDKQYSKTTRHPPGDEQITTVIIDVGRGIWEDEDKSQEQESQMWIITKFWYIDIRIIFFQWWLPSWWLFGSQKSAIQWEEQPANNFKLASYLRINRLSFKFKLRFGLAVWPGAKAPLRDSIFSSVKWEYQQHLPVGCWCGA